MMMTFAQLVCDKIGIRVRLQECYIVPYNVYVLIDLTLFLIKNANLRLFDGASLKILLQLVNKLVWLIFLTAHSSKASNSYWTFVRPFTTVIQKIA